MCVRVCVCGEGWWSPKESKSINILKRLRMQLPPELLPAEIPVHGVERAPADVLSEPDRRRLPHISCPRLPTASFSKSSSRAERKAAEFCNLTSWARQHKQIWFTGCLQAPSSGGIHSLTSSSSGRASRVMLTIRAAPPAALPSRAEGTWIRIQGR